MRSVTRRHLSVVGGIARFAQVTVVELPMVDGQETIPQPILMLNDREVKVRSVDDNGLINAALDGVRETIARLHRCGLMLHVARVESTYVDVHPDAVREAAISAATVLVQEKE